MANNSSDRKPFKPPFEILERKTKAVLIKYKDCMRNHAPHLGVNVVDGCGEFAPKRRRSEAARHADHDDLACAACGCHRNFHRKEVVKKITLKFIENEQANWFNFHPLSPQTIDDDEEEPVEIDEVLNEKTTKKPKN